MRLTPDEYRTAIKRDDLAAALEFLVDVQDEAERVHGGLVDDDVRRLVGRFRDGLDAALDAVTGDVQACRDDVMR